MYACRSICACHVCAYTSTRAHGHTPNTHTNAPLTDCYTCITAGQDALHRTHIPEHGHRNHGIHKRTHIKLDAGTDATQRLRGRETEGGRREDGVGGGRPVLQKSGARWRSGGAQSSAFQPRPAPKPTPPEQVNKRLAVYRCCPGPLLLSRLRVLLSRPIFMADATPSSSAD